MLVFPRAQGGLPWFWTLFKKTVLVWKNSFSIALSFVWVKICFATSQVLKMDTSRVLRWLCPTTPKTLSRYLHIFGPFTFTPISYPSPQRCLWTFTAPLCLAVWFG